MCLQHKGKTRPSLKWQVMYCTTVRFQIYCQKIHILRDEERPAWNFSDAHRCVWVCVKWIMCFGTCATSVSMCWPTALYISVCWRAAVHLVVCQSCSLERSGFTVHLETYLSLNIDVIPPYGPARAYNVECMYSIIWCCTYRCLTYEVSTALVLMLLKIRVQESRATWPYFLNNNKQCKSTIKQILKGQFTLKLKVHIFPLTFSAVC